MESFNPMDPQTMQCPYPWYQALRREDPVHFVAGLGMWVVTSKELVSQALQNHEVFSSAFGLPQMPPPAAVADQVAEITAQGWDLIPTLLTCDPPDHHYYRRMVSRAFTPRFVAQREPAIRQIADELIGALPVGEPVEIIEALAAPLPLRVIAHTLNVPEDRIGDFRRWSDQFALTIGAVIDEEGALEQARNLLQFEQYFAAQLEDRRNNPQDDLITGLVQAAGVDGDEPLTTGAALSILQQILIAGNETSRKLMTGTLHQLALHPHWWQWFKEDPAGRSANLVEESLRFLTPVQAMFRITKAETELGGKTIPAGQMVILNFGAANRDEATFDDGEEFDPYRANARSHLAFSQGIHACLGAALARLQARIALEDIVTRFDSIQLGPDNDFTYDASFMLRGLKRLSLIFEASA
ncbi:cytochrome P450 [Mycolicibacterium brumae]|uniref:Steroid C26-monooxygenase n=1 Tax=Mycolicibacterium brumae TaxID=85968 RepID=A0A2G5PHB4_9MYCO|nr:cytochrome P450 [Mycolicibacterium brumae]RWA20106.1 hypothetical protein MBRU_15850 [Mycolicibacterium brumae DSM 44177]